MESWESVDFDLPIMVLVMSFVLKEKRESRRLVSGKLSNCPVKESKALQVELGLECPYTFSVTKSGGIWFQVTGLVWSDNLERSQARKPLVPRGDPAQNYY